MTRQQILDLYFLDARSKLIELAAFLDRVERAEGKDDFRLKAFRTALAELTGNKRKKPKKSCSHSATRRPNQLSKPRAKAQSGHGMTHANYHQPLTLNHQPTCATSNLTPTWSAARRTTMNAWRLPVARRSANR